jgi:glycosyltransferase involved in cell wall biosynthesis
MAVRSHQSCTIVAVNYTAQARVLASSFARTQADAGFSTLVIDGTEADRCLEGVGTVLLPDDLGVEPATLRRMRTIYDVMEYATALKPALLMHLLRSGARSATYFDPDVRLYADVGDVFARAEADGLVLTPHATEPLPRDGRHLDEAEIMHAGIYNLGFVATGPSGFRFLSWWHQRLQIDAVVDLANALFTDQRWVDWAPAIDTPTVLRDVSLNVAYWNVHERALDRDVEGTWRVNGTPLRFFHFSGYDPASPWLLSKHQGAAPRGLLSEQPGLRALCDAYAEELVAAGHIDARRERYRHDVLPSGLRLTPVVRRLCRAAMVDADQAAPPDPWDDTDRFTAWLVETYVRAGPFGFSRLEESLWRSRADLQDAFPDPLGGSAGPFRTWLDTSPEAMSQYAAIGLEPPQRRPSARRTRGRPQAGWSVVGYARAELGVGEAGRRVARAIAHTGVPSELVGVSLGTLSRQAHAVRGEVADLPGYDNLLLAVNADQTPRVACMLGLEPPRGRVVGYWFWELETFPEDLHHAFTFVDEVWVATEFTRAAVAAATDKPVRVVPLPALVPSRPTPYRRRDLSIPEDRTTFLVNFDYLSVMERKNPLGAIEAYTRAFAPDEGTCLLVKSINGNHRILDRERVRLAVADRPDILLVEDYLSASQMRAAAELVDCVVSLHRSEGYGLNLADAMCCGTPVVATAYSGNMSYMDDTTALLVPFTMCEVGPGAEPYDPQAVWADPDLDRAAEAMRLVVDDPGLVASVTEAARTRMLDLAPSALAPQLLPLLLPGLGDAGLGRAS